MVGQWNYIEYISLVVLTVPGEVMKDTFLIAQHVVLLKVVVNHLQLDRLEVLSADRSQSRVDKPSLHLF